MKIIMTHILLYFTILILSGYFCKSQARENLANSINSLYDQNLKSELDKSDSTLSNNKNSGGFWFNLGLGSTTNTKINYNYNPDDFITFKAGFNFKYTNYLLSLGMDKSSTFPGGAWSINTYWFALGYSTNFPHWDASISFGPSFSEWKYYTENENHDIIDSPRSVGFIIQPQLLIHMKAGVGFGVIYTYNNSKEVKHTSISFVLLFGGWYK
jgi:hypothetical protein